MGAGLAGLSAGHWLSRQGVSCTVIERSLEVGGLARTVQRGGYRFDLGGCRFIGSSTEVQQLLRELLGPDLLTVDASSKIYFRGKLYRYPLQAQDLLRQLGPQQGAMALWSYAGSRIARSLPHHQRPRSLEEWLLDEFGETLFRAFFNDYNVKVWGLPCHRLSAELASRRIHGMRLLGSALGGILPKRFERFDALRKGHRFLYPRHGIGQLASALIGDIERKSRVIREGTVTKIEVERARVRQITYRDVAGSQTTIPAQNLVSSIPLPRLVYLLSPRPPADVLAAARALLFRDLVSVCLELRREKATDDSWLYVPDPSIKFARLLEPGNWSEAMSPPGRTSLVAEHYCFEGDHIWSLSDDELVAQTIRDLKTKLELIDEEDVVDGFVLRIRKPYPVYEVGYQEHLARIHRYLKSIVNLHAIGRGGLFRYYNVGHLVRSGIRAAENVLGAGHDLWGFSADNLPERSVFRVG